MRIIQLLLAFVLSIAAVSAAVVPPMDSPKRFSSSDVMKYTDWNSTVVGAATYFNTYIVPALNTLTTKGDMYTYNGTAIQRLPVGSNTHVVQCDSTQPLGIKWTAYTGADPRTTKGDLIIHDGATPQRLPVGPDTYILTLDSSQSLGVKWAEQGTNPFPVGSIVAWSPAAAGTSTIPAGWTLCDGTMSTPNLIGRFVIGSKPGTSSSSPSIGGFGYRSADTAYSANTHTHTGASYNSSTGLGSSGQIAVTGGSTSYSATAHNHTVTLTQTFVAGSCEPADYALVYIMKL